MALYDDIKSLIDQTIAQYQEFLADNKLSFQEALKLMGSATATFVKLVEKYTGFSGAEKKETVMAALTTLFDVVIVPAVSGKLPAWLGAMVSSVIRNMVLDMCSAWIDSLVDVFNRTSWELAPKEGVAAALEAPLVFNCLADAA